MSWLHHVAARGGLAPVLKHSVEVRVVWFVLQPLIVL